MSLWMFDWFNTSVIIIAALISLYIVRVNHLLKGIPSEVRKLSASPWTAEELKRTYRELEEHPIDYQDKLPPKLDRRYIVTGGNGEPQNPVEIVL